MSSNSVFHSPSCDLSQIDSLCLGSGRFLRSVLVPALNAANLNTAIFQTRGSSFMRYCAQTFDEKKSQTNSDLSHLLFYEVDTVEYDGNLNTEVVSCHAAGTLGTDEGKESMLKLLEKMTSIKVIGIGVTEAGIQPFSKALVHVTDLLRKCHSLITSNQPPTLSCPNPNGRISIINTDNVPNNGDIIKKYVLDIAKVQNEENSYSNGNSFLEFLQEGGGVIFHNSMVDRITSQRPGSNGMVPRCEPIPDKAIVIEDLGKDLPASLCSQLMKEKYGIVTRTKTGELDGDIALKLRVANGTHTSIAHTMALSSLLQTDVLSDTTNDATSILLHFLDSLFESQILQGAEADYGESETRAVYSDWRRRLCHAHFGLSTFFITQNGAAKGGIRITPTIRGLIEKEKDVCASTIFALAAILRFITPSKSSLNNPESAIYKGWLDPPETAGESSPSTPSDENTITYADGLRYNLVEGWYEFKCDCMIQLLSETKPVSLPRTLQHLVETSQQPSAFEGVVAAYLTAQSGGNMGDIFQNPSTLPQFRHISKAVAVLYARMVAGDGVLSLLKEMYEKTRIYEQNGFDTPSNVLIDDNVSEKNGYKNSVQPLHFRLSPIPEHSNLMKCRLNIDHTTISSIVTAEVASAIIIDLHTHLLPPSHGPLCLWGVDELLTYHYLVAEYFMTAPPSITPVLFYAKNKQEQANLIWKALFIDRTPISEACRGVITTLQALGLSDAIRQRDLDAIRKFYSSFRDTGVAGAEQFSDLVYQRSGLQFAVMTNIPFSVNEAQYWQPKKKEYSKHYRSALRVDPLLAGDRETIETTLRASGYEVTLQGARQYLLDWIDVMNPEYMMASTPHNFKLSSDGRGPLSGIRKTGVNTDAIKEPFAFVDLASKGDTALGCDVEEDETASIIDENSDLLTEVLMKVCEQKDLPLALKIGAHRGVNPELESAGDGVVAFADGGVLARLCSRFPKVRFLATFLSRNNQHEACVLASKFRNLHIYGCWWYCNNPSIIKEITEMRLEMLGTAFTVQHSDARVLDQLIYKWSHSRGIIAVALAEQYVKIMESGWQVTRAEVRRDVQRLFGGSYLDFMKKSLI